MMQYKYDMYILNKKIGFYILIYYYCYYIHFNGKSFYL